MVWEAWLFDCTSYFVTVGLSNTVQLWVLENYSGMLELLRVSFVLPIREIGTPFSHLLP